MGLFRVMWEIDVEADGWQEACFHARDAFATDTSRGQISVCRFHSDGTCEPVEEVVTPFTGPVHAPSHDPVSLHPDH